MTTEEAAAVKAEVDELPNEAVIKKARVLRKLPVITTSEIQTWRDCNMKHHLAYRERLRPLLTPKALAIGQIFHGGMSAGIRTMKPATMALVGESGMQPVVAPGANQARIDAALAGIDAEVGKWTAVIVQHTQVQDYDKLADETQASADMVKWMLTHYFNSTEADLRNLVLIETEQAFSVRVRDSKGRKTSLTFQGVRDAVYFDPAYNQVVLHEHKTTSSDPAGLGKRAEMDPQTAGYLYSLREDLIAGKLKLPDGTVLPPDTSIGPVAYNGLRKKKPSIPKVNQNGEVSVAQCDTTVELYDAALVDMISARGIKPTAKHADFREALRLKGDTFFNRFEYVRSEEEIERWRIATLTDAKRIREANTNPDKRVRNPGNCSMAWSLPCTYRSVCLDPDRPELRAMFRVADDPHGEVRDAEADAVTVPV